MTARLVLVTCSTGHYDFTTVAESIPDALAALEEAYATHYAQMPPGIAEPDVMAELLADGEYNARWLTPGEVLRDGDTIARTRNP